MKENVQQRVVKKRITWKDKVSEKFKEKIKEHKWETYTYCRECTKKPCK